MLCLPHIMVEVSPKGHGDRRGVAVLGLLPDPGWPNQTHVPGLV